MRTVFLVTPEEVAKARSLEEKLIAIPPESGVLFVGVSVEPANDLRIKPIYEVFVGCSPAMEPVAIQGLVLLLLKEEIAEGHLFRVSAHRGLSRK